MPKDVIYKDIMYSRKTIVESLNGILDRVNHGSVAVYDTPKDKSYFDGYRDAIKNLLFNFGEKQFETVMHICNKCKSTSNLKPIFTVEFKKRESPSFLMKVVTSEKWCGDCIKKASSQWNRYDEITIKLIKNDPQRS